MKMERKPYYLHIFVDAGHNALKAKKIEKTIRKFLLSKADAVRLTRVYYWEGLFPPKSKAADDNPQVVEVLRALNKYLKKKIINNKRFNDIAQGKNKKYTHYFYKLSPKVKSLINRETLIWPYIPPYSKYFYGLEDPTFYAKGKMIAAVITHETEIMLYLTNAEKAKLEKQKVPLHLIPNNPRP